MKIIAMALNLAALVIPALALPCASFAQEAEQLCESTAKPTFETSFDYAPGDFGLNWTNVVYTKDGDKMIWYNAKTGYMLIGKIQSNFSFKAIKEYGNFAKGYTHIVDTPKGVLWFNAEDNSGELGKFDYYGNYKKIESYPKGFFTPKGNSSSYSHMTAGGDNVFFYSFDSGAAKLGKVE